MEWLAKQASHINIKINQNQTVKFKFKLHFFKQLKKHFHSCPRQNILSGFCHRICHGKSFVTMPCDRFIVTGNTFFNLAANKIFASGLSHDLSRKSFVTFATSFPVTNSYDKPNHNFNIIFLFQKILSQLYFVTSLISLNTFKVN